MAYIRSIRDPQNTGLRDKHQELETALGNETKNRQAKYFESEEARHAKSIERIAADVDRLGVIVQAQEMVQEALNLDDKKPGRTQEELNAIFAEFTVITSDPEKLNPDEYSTESRYGKDLRERVVQLRKDLENKKISKSIRLASGYSYHDLVEVIGGTSMELIRNGGKIERKNDKSGIPLYHQKFIERRAHIAGELLAYETSTSDEVSFVTSISALRDRAEVALKELETEPRADGTRLQFASAAIVAALKADKKNR